MVMRPASSSAVSGRLREARFIALTLPRRIQRLECLKKWTTRPVEVTNVSRHGFWLLIGGIERFVSFRIFPWFRNSSIAELTKVTLPSRHHLYWPALDIDLAVESIDHPERYPLVSRAQGATPRKTAATSARESTKKYGTPRRRRSQR